MSDSSVTNDDVDGEEIPVPITQLEAAKSVVNQLVKFRKHVRDELGYEYLPEMTDNDPLIVAIRDLENLCPRKELPVGGRAKLRSFLHEWQEVARATMRPIRTKRRVTVEDHMNVLAMSDDLQQWVEEKYSLEATPSESKPIKGQSKFKWPYRRMQLIRIIYDHHFPVHGTVNHEPLTCKQFSSLLGCKQPNVTKLLKRFFGTSRDGLGAYYAAIAGGTLKDKLENEKQKKRIPRPRPSAD